MRATLALTLSLGASAQYTRYSGIYGARAPASAVHVAPVRTGMISPYALRAPVRTVVAAPAPVAAAPAPVAKVEEVEKEKPNPKAEPGHALDYAKWEDAYLTSKAEDANALANSPVFNWNHDATSKEGIWLAANGKDTTTALGLQSKKGEYNVATRKLRRAIESGADDYTIKLLQHKNNEKKYKYLGKVFKQEGIGSTGSIDLDFIDFFAERESYLQTAEKYNAGKASDEDLKYANWDLMFALPSSTGLFSSDSSFKTVVGLMSASRDLKDAQSGYDDAVAAYEKDSSVANFYEAEIAEKNLELAEVDYTNEIAGNLGSLSTLMNGNYQTALDFKSAKIEAEIAALEEQIAAEKYLAAYGSYPYGRRNERPSLQTQQRLYYNLLN